LGRDLNGRGEIIFALALVLADAGIWLASLYLAFLVENDFDLGVDFRALLVLGFVAVIAHLVFSKLLGLYRPRLRWATMEEIEELLAVALLVGFLMWVANSTIGSLFGFPQGLFFVAAPYFLVIAGALRVVLRRIAARASKGKVQTRALIYGAGNLGEAVSSQLNKFNSPYVCVGLIDDDKSKLGKRMLDSRVLGSWDQLNEIANKTAAQMVLVCIASFSAEKLRQIEKDSRALGLKTLIFPSVDVLLHGKTGLSELREIEIEDVVGRRVFRTRTEVIRGYLEGKSVLVTGAGGSIGSEICRQVLDFSPSRLVMLDRDESGLNSTQIELYGDGLLNNPDLVLADVRDPQALLDIFEQVKPDVVFHAAALKHLSLLESHPEEAWKTNVLGTLNVLRAAESVGTGVFVNISTDKAADPTSVLGRSKKTGEALTSWFAQQTGKRFMSVRFGNVLGSRGSLVPNVQQLISRGHPVTVTDPDATRFFMTIPEASQLVLEAGALGEGGQTMVFDMGEPVKVLDVVNKMIELSGKEIPIVFSGLRDGEKLHEDLFSEDEEPRVSAIQPLISITTVTPVNPDEIEALSLNLDK